MLDSARFTWRTLRLYDAARELLREWPKLSVRERFKKIQAWNLLRGQDEWIRLLEQFQAHHKAHPKAGDKWEIDLRGIPHVDQLRDSEKTYGQFFREDKIVDVLEFLPRPAK